MKRHSLQIAVLAILVISTPSFAQAPIHFDFEETVDEWTVPDWCLEQTDCVVKGLSIVQDQASSGKSSIKVTCDFPGKTWAAAIVEYEKDIDLRGYKSISADIYVPKTSPAVSFDGRIIVTAGPSLWIEMRDPVVLRAGQWTTIKAPLDMSTSGELRDWKCATHKDCILSHLDEVKKIAIRIEQNASDDNPSPPYKGSVYIDNVTIE